MNPYYYWYFAIYHIYAKCSKDKDFYIFATGMFSLLGFILVHIIVDFIFEYMIKSDIFSKSFPHLVSLFFGISILNVFLFIIKKKHQVLYWEVYLVKRKKWKDTVAIIFSIIVFISLFYHMGIIEGWINQFKK